MDLERFTDDVTTLTEKMTIGESEQIICRTNFVKNRLIELYKRNIVKINHSAMELVCAKHLIHCGYSVDVEQQLTDILVCDLYASKDDSKAIVEIETGFIPPEHALDPLSYYTARIASKIARYSKFANRFVLATPPVSLLPIPKIFGLSSKDRNYQQIEEVKLICNKYYRNPPVNSDEILNGQLHTIYIINIDEGKVLELDIGTYFESILKMKPFSNLII